MSHMNVPWSEASVGTLFISTSQDPNMWLLHRWFMSQYLDHLPAVTSDVSCYICSSMLSVTLQRETRKREEPWHCRTIWVSLRLLGGRYSATFRCLVSVRRWWLKRAASGSSAARCNMIVFTQAAAWSCMSRLKFATCHVPLGFCLLSSKLCNLFHCSWIADKIKIKKWDAVWTC